MTYLIITAKHHDGFAMFDSEVSAYNIVDHAKFGRDPLKELSEACAEAGIKFCVYYSHREDWDNPYAYGNTWDFDTSQASLDTMDHPELFRTYPDDKALPQLKELLTHYGPLGIIWFDRGMYTPEQGNEFADLVHALQPNCLVNGRVGHYDQELLGDYHSLTDNGMPVGGILLAADGCGSKPNLACLLRLWELGLHGLRLVLEVGYTWGWAPFHYGRWFCHSRIGWCWAPGYVWGPSWVSWRYNYAYCGWAPLPPAACYRPGFGFTYYGRHAGASCDFGIGIGSWCFVSVSHFNDRHFHRYAVPHHDAPPRLQQHGGREQDHR